MTRFAPLSLISMVLCCLAFPVPAKSAPRGKPNILFIITDDQRFDMMGNVTPHLITPAMDRLAKEGVRFENAFVTTAICAASRASMLTGMVERSHGYTFGTPPLQQQWVDASYPTLLRKNGYRTGYVGKFGVGLPAKETMDEMFDSSTVMNRNPYFKKQADGSMRHLTDITGDKSIEFIAQCTADKPWMLCMAFNAPHAEDNDARQYIWPDYVHTLYQDLKVKPAPLSQPAFYNALPEFLRDGTMNRERWHWRFDPWPRKNKAAEMTKGYYRMITAADHNVARVREAIEKQGFGDNTVVILIGDNGYFLGERGYAGKWLPYEPSIHVPLLYFDPRPGSKMKAGARPTAIVANIDVPATMLDLAAIGKPASMQGRSLLPLTRGETPGDWRRDLWIEHLMMNESIRKHEGVRNTRYKYSRYFEANPILEELYDLEKDPLETQNLINDPEHKTLAQQLRHRTDSLRNEYGGVFKPPPPKQRKQKASAGKQNGSKERK